MGDSAPSSSEDKGTPEDVHRRDVFVLSSSSSDYEVGDKGGDIYFVTRSQLVTGGFQGPEMRSRYAQVGQ